MTEYERLKDETRMRLVLSRLQDLQAAVYRQPNMCMDVETSGREISATVFLNTSIQDQIKGREMRCVSFKFPQYSDRRHIKNLLKGCKNFIKAHFESV